jgi:hypothetical protein
LGLLLVATAAATLNDALPPSAPRAYTPVVLMHGMPCTNKREIEIIT